jgi:DNA oxidative demethylase
MHGVVARRRVRHFGWHYGYDRARIEPGEPIPDFLLPVRARLAGFAAVTPDELGEALVTEYAPGAGIGWHRDAPAFGIVAAVSLLASCRMRFRRGEVGNWETAELELEPRSAYLIAGESRSKWQHGIPPAKALRYSITFRTLRRMRQRVVD